MKGAPIYSSLPEGSVLLARLRKDASFSRLFTTLYPEGEGPFDLSRLEGDIDGIVEGLIGEGYLGAFGGIETHLRELRVELARTERVFPGTARSRLVLDLDPDLLESRLTEYLEGRGNDSAGKLVITLLYGGGRVAPDIFREKEGQLYLVSLPVVQYGARVLREVKSEELFPGNDVSAMRRREPFDAWRRFYLHAAERGDVVLVYIN